MILLHRLFDSFRLRAAGASPSTSQAATGPLIVSVYSRPYFRRVRRSLPLNRPTPDGFRARPWTWLVTPRTRSGDWPYLALLRTQVSAATLSTEALAGIYTPRFRGEV
jgi:hypothetical protein